MLCALQQSELSFSEQSRCFYALRLLFLQQSLFRAVRDLCHNKGTFTIDVHWLGGGKWLEKNLTKIKQNVGWGRGFNPEPSLVRFQKHF